MSNRDDLRRRLLADDAEDEEPAGLTLDQIGYELPGTGETREPPKDPKFLGLTAGERAFLAVVMFFNVLIIGIGLLIVTGRLVI